MTAIRTGLKLPDDAEPLPDAARVMMNTRALNDWLGTVYTLDEVAEMEWLTFDIMAAIKRAADPPKVEELKGPKVPKILRGRR